MPDFVSISEFEAVDLSDCADGLFQSSRELFRNVIVATHAEERRLVYLDDPKGASAIPAPIGQGYGLSGVLWAQPKFEVDLSTQFNPDRADEQIGDLIIDTALRLVSRSADGWSDKQRTPLWEAARSSKQRLGFRGWRLVKLIRDQPHVLYEKSSPKVGDP